MFWGVLDVLGGVSREPWVPRAFGTPKRYGQKIPERYQNSSILRCAQQAASVTSNSSPSRLRGLMRKHAGTTRPALMTTVSDEPSLSSSGLAIHFLDGNMSLNHFDTSGNGKFSGAFARTLKYSLACGLSNHLTTEIRSAPSASTSTSTESDTFDYMECGGHFRHCIEAKSGRNNY